MEQPAYSTSSPLVSNALKRQRTNNNRAEKHQNRKVIMDEKRRRQTIMSPSHAASPKAQCSMRLKSPASSKVLQGNFQTVACAGNSPSVCFDSPRPLLTIASGKGLSIDQMNNTFQEWMKLVAADNKINAKNSWSLALIDYFSDLTLLKDGEEINFERASCTLDGCIKIYTSRVDCVADETGKLLDGLMEEQRQQQEQEIAESSSNALATAVGSNLKKKKTLVGHSAPTLERNSDALNCSKREQQAQQQAQPFPLTMSKKMLNASNAEGSEATAKRGWLLGNIPIGHRGYLRLLGEEQAAADSEWENDDEIAFDFASIQGFQGIEQKVLFPSLPLQEQEQQEEYIRMRIEQLSSINIEEMQSISEIDQAILQRTQIPTVESEAQMQVDSPASELLQTDDFGGFSEQVPEGEEAPHSSTSPEPQAEFEEVQDEMPSTQNHFNLAESMLELSIDATTGETTHDAPEIDAQAIERANATFASSWAGPQHWKIKRQISAFASQSSKASLQQLNQNQNAASKPRLSKEEAQARKSFVDFVNCPAPDLDALFAKGNLGHLSEEALSKSANLLPEDFQITAKQMFSLFLKPKIKINAPKQKQHAFHTQQPYEEERDDFGGGAEDNYDLNSGQQDDSEAQCGAFDSQDHSINTSPMKGAFAFTAEPMLKIKPSQQKNIDIQQLKKRIWSAILEQKKSGVESFPFSIVTERLAGEFSKAYCFICLLHLANEEGLNLQNEQPSQQLVVKF